MNDAFAAELGGLLTSESAGFLPLVAIFWGGGAWHVSADREIGVPGRVFAVGGSVGMRGWRRRQAK